MSRREAAAFCYSIIAILLTWLFLATLYRGYRRDALRERLADLEQELMNQVFAGSFGLLDPASLRLRRLLLDATAVVHRLTLTRMLLFWLFLRHAPVSSPPSRVDPRLAGLEDQLCAVVVAHAAFGGPALWTLLPGNCKRAARWVVPSVIAFCVDSLKPHTIQ